MSFQRTWVAGLLILGSNTTGIAKTLEVPSDFPTIQQAVDQANPGDVVEIDDGTYFENVVITTSGITLRGDDAIIDAQYMGSCIKIVGEDVRVEELCLINADIALYCTGDGVEVIDNEFRSSSDRTILIEGSNALIRDNELRACNRGILCITATATSFTRVEGNLIVANNGRAIDLVGGRFLVRKNELLNVQNAIHVFADHPTIRTEIIGNCVDRSDGVGILVSHAGAGFNVRGNELTRIGDDGICGVGDDIDISENEVSICEGDGIALTGDRGAIVDNDIERVGGEGIQYDGAGPALITDNAVKWTGEDGILLQGNDLIISDNKVTHCYGDGIDLVGGSNCRIEENTTSKNAHEGIDNSGKNTAINGNKAKKNGNKIGPDIAGSGNNGVGTVASFLDNNLTSGGLGSPQRLDSRDNDFLE